MLVLACYDDIKQAEDSTHEEVEGETSIQYT